MPERNYAIRYSIEPWNKPVPLVAFGQKIRNGITVSTDNHGYADRLFIISEVDCTYLLLDSEEGANLSRERLLSIKEAIDHYLEHHA